MREFPSFNPEELRRIIQRCYGIKVFSMTPIKRVFRVETNLGTRFFKPFFLGEERLKLIVKAKEHLVKRGFEQFVPFIPTLDGKQYFRYKNHLFYMNPWVQGHPSNYDNPFELRQGVRLFAQFHEAARGFTPPQEMHRCLGRWPEMFSERLRELEECWDRAREIQRPSAFDVGFLRKIDYYLKQTEKSIELLANTEYQNLCKRAAKEEPFCHHDPAHHNILVTTANEFVLIDFDYLLEDLHLHDLASLIIRNAKESDWNLNRIRYVINAYREIREVTLEEMAVIRAFLTFPYDFWFLVRARYIEERPVSSAYFMKELARKTRDEEIRQRFLDQLMLCRD